MCFYLYQAPAQRSSPKASIAIKERLRLAVVAMVPERREAGGAPPLALLVAKFATGGRGGSITSLASRGGFGALAGGCASLDATDTRVPAFAGNIAKDSSLYKSEHGLPAFASSIYITSLVLIVVS